MHHATASISPDAPAWTASLSPAQRLRIRARGVGVLVLAGFGFAWTAAGLLAGGLPGWCWICLVSVVTALVSHGVQTLRHVAPPHEPLPADVDAKARRAARWLRWSTAGEALGIVLAIVLVANLGHPQWGVAAAMAVVGVHFVPLAIGLSYRPHLATAAGLAGWALAYPWLFEGGAASAAGPLGAGLVLLASAMVSQRATSRGW